MAPVPLRIVSGVLGKNIQNHWKWSVLSHHFRSPLSILQPSGSRTRRAYSVGSPKSNSKNSQEEEDLDKPVQFTTSAASKWSARDSLSGDAFPDSPWYQPFVVTFSVGMFLLYFCVLREENDIDEEIDKPLWKKVPSLERQQLQIVLDYNRKHNIDSSDIEDRLRQIAVEEEALRNKSFLKY